MLLSDSCHVLIAATLSLVLGAAAQSSPVKIEFSGGVFTAEGEAVSSAPRNEDAARLFRILVDGAPPDSPPVDGEYTRGERLLSFRPRYPVQPGLAYRAIWRDGEASVVIRIPAENMTPVAVVERVYPSASVLPENQLKLYLHFSEPMSRGEAWRAIKLIDETGQAVDLPFLEIDEELWDRDGKRLTLLFDPGRIKRGLLPQQEVGAALQPGKRYTLVVDRNWRDAANRPLKQEFRKTFSVREADREPLDVKKWKVREPAAGSKDPLIVDFPEPVDAAMAVRMLEVADATGFLDGEASMERDETRWRFVPAVEWRAGSHSLRVPATLEDLAGNRIGRAFDVDLDRFDRVDAAGKTPEIITLPFRVSALSKATPRARQASPKR